MDGVDVVLANNDRVTVRLGSTFLKVDADHDRSVKEADERYLFDAPGA